MRWHGTVIDKQVITFQGHPEFDKDYLRYLLGLRRNIIGEEDCDRALRSLSKPLDKRPIRQWLETFIRSDQATLRLNYCAHVKQLCLAIMFNVD